jgi:dolichol-phosphate mannosyltransferase
VHAGVLRRIEFKNVSERYFFESDMLVNLGGIRAVVRDIPMEAVYGNERSGLKIKKIVFDFVAKHLREFAKRLLYSYFLRDFNPASLNLMLGAALVLFGLVFGSAEWFRSINTEVTATTGTVMLATLPIILGFQLLLSFLSYDIANEPTIPLQRVAGCGDDVRAAGQDRHGK